MSRNTIAAILSPADREKAQPILDALKNKGFRLAEEKDAKAAVLLFLSEAFAADESAQERFFTLEGAGREIIPVDLDGFRQNELMRGALMAKNAIAASGRTPEEIAERISSAEAFREKKSPLPKLLIAAAALLLAVGAGIWLWKSAAAGEPETPAAGADAPLSTQARYGLTEEDLAAIADVVIVSDKIGFFTMEDFAAYGAWPREEHFATLDEWNDVHWYSTEDGQELEMVRYDDLHVLELMPNLHHLSMVLVEADAEALPDLSGASFLEDVSVLSCDIDTLDWLAGAPMKTAYVRFTPVLDFAPLTACGRLSDLWVDMYGTGVTTDFSSFAPPQLRNLWLWHANTEGTIDFSGMKDCRELRSLYLGDVPVKALSFLGGAPYLRALGLDQLNGVESLSGLEGLPLETVELKWCGSLRDISALRETTGALRTLEIHGCERIADFTPISGCTGLHTIVLQEMDSLRDASFLAPLPGLKSIHINGCELNDLGFLEGFADAIGMELELGGDIRDYSALSYVKNYQRLRLDPRTRYNPRGSLENFYAYLEGARIKQLSLQNCTDLDLSRLPTVTEELELSECDLKTLESMPAWQLGTLRLNHMRTLTSLNGIENLVALSMPLALTVEVCSCLRLTDWSALENSSLRMLNLDDLYVLPEIDNIVFRYLVLRNLPGLTDLQLLSGIDNSKSYDAIRIEEMPELRDISALRRLQIRYLAVPPQVEEQAQELVENGTLGEYEIAYPEGSWEWNEGDFELLSLDELETLPKALLRRVDHLVIAGDRVVDERRYEIREDWDNRKGNEGPTITLFDRETGEETKIENGSMTDLGALSELSGLRYLMVCCQGIESLEGIQNLEELRSLRVNYCYKLEDVSAVFALQELENLDLRETGAASIRGVQNLGALRSLSVASTAVSDLSPLWDVDYSVSAANGGFELSAGGTNCEDYSAIEAIPSLSYLDLNGVSAARWPEIAKLGELRALSAHGAHLTQDMLEELIETHPELEELQIPYNTEITDLTALAELPELRRVIVTSSMSKAVKSLEGKDRPFELEIW